MSKLLGALYGYKGILLLFGVFLAWETRNVTIPALNDSKYIGMSVYNVVILSAIGATVSMVLSDTTYYELLHVLVSVVVLLSTTVTLTMVFLPKVIEKSKKESEMREYKQEDKKEIAKLGGENEEHIGGKRTGDGEGGLVEESLKFKERGKREKEEEKRRNEMEKEWKKRQKKRMRFKKH